MTHLKTLCDAVDPRLWPAILAIGVVVLMQIIKGYASGLWARMPTRLRALPPLLIAAVASGASGGEVREILTTAVMAAVLGVGVYHMGKRAL